ncbi:hypothetical protein AB0H82_10195 [Streptomyces sp. NPDC050732]|uniref:hypothetical protein n=1 Tax=Streptomyces sp. NPDC050732 TaxID=3154632 RepID=UPI003448F8DB
MRSTKFGRSTVIALSATALAAGAVLTTPNSAPAQPTTKNSATAAPVSCPPGSFCIYTMDRVFIFKDCYKQELPEGLNSGSWFNNQSPRTTAKLYNKAGQLIYTIGAPSKGSFGNWSKLGFIDPC